ncbi:MULTISPECIES: LysR substrate-binding domain-containing protein [Streptomyces]|uniref:LysR substrate-binding domain-containing protein n=1 Tax=Streptomyces ramulosus TaxID=47762 RepID=A0ABW1FTM8_9ACTN
MELPGPQLRTLLELARGATMTAAAAALGYTPGAVSQHIAALERATGARLVRRAGRRVELTDAGRTLAVHAERILAAQAAALAALERGRGEVAGRLVLGVFGSAAAVLLPPALHRLRARHPAVRVVSREVDVDQAYAEVCAGRVDLALGLDYPDAPLPRDGKVALVRLRTERFALAVPAGCPPAEAAEGALRLARAAEWAWILPAPASHYGRAMRTACRRAGFEPRVAHEVTDTATSLAMVAAGLGVAPVTELMLRLRSEGVAVVPLEDAPARHLVVAVDAVTRRRPPVAALIGALGEGPVVPGAGAGAGAGAGVDGAVAPDAEAAASAEAPPDAEAAPDAAGPRHPPGPGSASRTGEAGPAGARADSAAAGPPAGGYGRPAAPRAAATRPRTGA